MSGDKRIDISISGGIRTGAAERRAPPPRGVSLLLPLPPQLRALPLLQCVAAAAVPPLL